MRELAKQALSSTKEGYDQLAPKFDYTPFLTSKELVDQVIKYLTEDADGKPINTHEFNSAIDLCTGTGAGVEGLIPIVSNEIVGVDWSEPMLAEAKKKFAGVTKPKIRLVCENIFDISYPGKFDLVTCFGALGHIEKSRQKEFVNLIYHLLKPGGRFAFVTADKPKWYQPSAWPYYIFDAVMRIRNWAIKPEFVMYYINFLLPDAFRLFNSSDWTISLVAPLRINGGSTSAKLVVVQKDI